MNGSYTNASGKYYTRKLQDSLYLLEGDDQELQLIHLRQEDSGFYSCVVTNEFDYVVSTGYVEVLQHLGEEQDSPVQGLPVWLFAVFGILGLVLVLAVAVMCTMYRHGYRVVE